MYNGVARYLFDVDTSAINNRGLGELMKPVTDTGTRRVVFKWCSDNRSLLLIAYGTQEKALDVAERAALGQILDGLLQPQQDQKRLRFMPLEGHLESIAQSADAKNEKDNGMNMEGAPEAK